MKQDLQRSSFDLVWIKYIKRDSIKSNFTKLESKTIQRRACITYKIDSGTHGNLIPFKIFKSLFQRSRMEALYVTKDNTVVLKMYNNSNIDQLGVCMIKPRPGYKVARCRFLVVPGNGPVLLGMPDIDLLGTLKIMC